MHKIYSWDCSAAGLQFSDIINKLAECQGKCCTFLKRGTQKPGMEDPHIITCDNDRAKPLEQPSMDVTWAHLARSVKLLLNFSFYYFVVRNTVQPRAAPALVWSNVLYPDSDDKGPGLGVKRKKNNNSEVSGELSVNLKVSPAVLCQHKTGIWFK